MMRSRNSYARMVRLALLSLVLLLLASTVSSHPEPTMEPTRVRRQADASINTELLPTGATTIESQPQPTTSASIDRDPLLAIMPDFVFSMPAQIVVDGVNLALVSILAIQLVFTAQYHYPFSRKNYCLQVASVIMLLISLAVHLNAVLAKLHKQSHQWPYMFAYIGVQIPPQDGSWNRAQQALYLLMRAISIALVHVSILACTCDRTKRRKLGVMLTTFLQLTHIQFLTLLYPSALEARLILWMLGPLALAASAMEFTNLASEDDVKTSDLGDAIRNICNSALFLLYTSALFIWGFLVNRRRAWRTDGGTAAFGAGSVGLAVINTTLSFVEIAYDRLWWLPDLCWTLTIWQSWLGFWWWVGSGMGIGEVEDRAERQERKLRKEQKLKRRREREERARQKAVTTNGSGTSAAAVASSALSENSDAIIGSMRRLRARFTGDTSTEAQASLSRRQNRGTRAEDGSGDAIELERLNDGEALTSIAIEGGRRDATGEEARTYADSSSDTQPTTSGMATSSEGWLNTATNYIAAHQPNFIRRRIRRLRLAHAEAARKAATEQSALRDQVLNRQSAPQGPGLRTMIGEHRNHSQQHGGSSNIDARLNHADTMSSSIESSRNKTVLLPKLDRNQSAGSSTLDVSARRESASTMPTIGSPRQPEAQNEDAWVDEDERHVGQADISEQEEIATSAEAGSRADRVDSQQGPSWSWRGGLRTLRMRDRTTYD